MPRQTVMEADGAVTQASWNRMARAKLSKYLIMGMRRLRPTGQDGNAATASRKRTGPAFRSMFPPTLISIPTAETAGNAVADTGRLTIPVSPLMFRKTVTSMSRYTALAGNAIEAIAQRAVPVLLSRSRRTHIRLTLLTEMAGNAAEAIRRLTAAVTASGFPRTATLQNRRAAPAGPANAGSERTVTNASSSGCLQMRIWTTVATIGTVTSPTVSNRMVAC